jgi:SAM-dependent methyltransferase
MEIRDTDRDWECFGEFEPYWSVQVEEQYRKANLTEDAVRQFYAKGERQVAWFFDTIRTRLDERFAPASALDFGCGVGRLAFPLARRCRSVVGVDVSRAMLHEAETRRDQWGLTNVSFARGDDDLSAVSGPFDLITSYIVLQHIPPSRGERLFSRLLDLLADGGVGVLHLTYSKDWYDSRDMHLPPPVPPLPSGLRYHLKSTLRLLRERVRSSFQRREAGNGHTTNGEAPFSPAMQMNDYNLNRLCHFLQKAGVRGMHTEFTDHGGHFGIVLFFQKKTKDPYHD